MNIDNLTTTEKAVLNAIEAWPNQTAAYYAGYTGMTIRTVKSMLNAMKGWGFIASTDTPVECLQTWTIRR